VASHEVVKLQFRP